MMFILDTNVVSELRKEGSGRADRRVAAWAATQTASSFFLSVVTVTELEVGVLHLERRNDAAQASILRRWLETTVLREFGERILAVDVAVARRVATLHVPNRRPERDAMIAATALVHAMTVVTRNLADFEHTGVKLLNPWLA